ncbi:hypothetical protein C5Z25_04470 [Lactobacillus sp. CBA3605]|uniref:hypothetical protein n=1 Tax=Lactobacillus sp. CBA3605 TaxID=2099788 RepID=UPI000CFAB97D|nr:hypothetical protein [Lactobacillus sp. CBA3605]AVK61056.1 hypothetical protein C5Z25_04470 [Lactobacillus sp. CBA3605]
MSFNQVFLLVWCLLIASLIGIVVILFFLRGVFQPSNEVQNRSEKKQRRQKILQKPKAEYRTIAMVSALTGLGMLILIWVGVALMYFQLYQSAFITFAVASFLFIGFDVVYVVYQYKYWLKHPDSDIVPVSQRKFKWIISLRTLRIIILTLVLLLPAVFSATFYEILIAVLK